MSKIVFLCDLEEGHLLPTFGLAHSLKKNGHEVSYLSAADNEHLVKEQGFTFNTVLENVYPRGYKQKIKSSQLIDTKNTYINMHTEHIIKGAYDSFMKHDKADIYLVNVLLSFDMLVMYHKYGIKPVVLTAFRNRMNTSITQECLNHILNMTLAEKCSFLELLSEMRLSFDSFGEVVKPLTSLCEFRLWPSEFEIDSPAADTGNVYYLEPSIRTGTFEFDVYATYKIPAEKKIIYASMGSQALRYGAACDNFFNKIINIMKYDAFKNFHFILCIDKKHDRARLNTIPGNATILDWAPQLDILKVASVAIIHGGLGSIKECIYYGVPMIVFPQGYDQPSNAECVVYHKLGFADEVRTVSEDALISYISQTLTNPGIKTAIQRMQTIFREKENKKIGCSTIEKMLSEKTTTKVIKEAGQLQE